MTAIDSSGSAPEVPRFHSRKRAKNFWILSSARGITGVIIVSMSIVLAIFGRLLAPSSPAAINLSQVLRPPSLAHPFGTDEAGRDLLSRVLAGATYTLPTAFVVVIVSVLVGLAIGIVAGYFGGWYRDTLMRITELFLSFPALLIAIAMAAALGPGLRQSAIAIMTVSWAPYARLAQVQVTGIRHLDFIAAARGLGSGPFTTIRRHVLPNSIGPILTKATMDVGFAIEWIAGLGFIGLGVNPPTPEWGSMIATSHEYILTAWWYVTFPSLALMIVVVGFNSLGGALDEHAANVSRSGRRSRWPLARHSTLLIDSKTKEMR